jgi:putative transposase
MPVSELLKSPFVPNNYYHLVFKSIDGILLFQQAADYRIFLERFKQFTNVVFDNWAYCLLSNHAHFIIKTKPVETIIKNIAETELSKQTVSMKKLLTATASEIIFDEMIERQVNSFMVSFANFTKNKYRHHGGLFQKPFKRLKIDTDAWLQTAIIYIHINPLKHKVFYNCTDYPYSSYPAFTGATAGYCVKEEVLHFFGGLNQFIQLHNEKVKYYYDKGFPESKLE